MNINILPIYVGGTICSVETENGLKPNISFEDFKNIWLGDCVIDCDICVAKPVELFGEAIDSSIMQIKHIQKIAHEIIKNYNDFDAFLIIHGTDTMAFTSSFLFFLLPNSPKPIILTGAQRTILQKNSDARQNLADSLGVASLKKGGVWIVFGGLVLNGVKATKIDTQKDIAFVQNNGLNLTISDFMKNYKNYKNDNANNFTDFLPNFASNFASNSVKLSKNIEIIYLSPATTPKNLKHYLENSSFRAIIVLVFGTGGQRDEVWREIGKWAKKYNKIVIVKSQCVFGETDIGRYEAGREGVRQGFISANNMTLEASFAKLSYLLARFDGVKKIKKEFLKDYIGENS